MCCHTNKLADAHNYCSFREAKKLNCLDTLSGAKICAIKIIAAFEKLKSCFEELQLIFAISQSDLKEKNLHFCDWIPILNKKNMRVRTEPIRGLQTIGLKNDSIERKLNDSIVQIPCLFASMHQNFDCNDFGRYSFLIMDTLLKVK